MTAYLRESDDDGHRAPAVFIHAMGRSGPEAWPRQAEFGFGRQAAFLTRRGWRSGENQPAFYSFTSEAQWLAAQLTEPAHIVGHSWSGVVALELALSQPALVESLILCEPALFTIAADAPVVREHIDRMSPAYDPGLSVEEFGAKYFRAWGLENDPDGWTPERYQTVARQQLHMPPWESSIDQRRLRLLAVPTLVVTSGSQEMFEIVADFMALNRQVERLVLSGPTHRPQDGPGFNNVAARWWDYIEAR